MAFITKGFNHEAFMRTKAERFIQLVSKETKSKRLIRAIHTARFEGNQVETVHKRTSKILVIKSFTQNILHFREKSRTCPYEVFMRTKLGRESRIPYMKQS
jgi:hypothetical protein